MPTSIPITTVQDQLGAAFSVTDLSPLAQGGQKYVFKCMLENVDAVAKVVLLPDNPDRLHVLERAQREVEILAAVDSPRVVRVLSEVAELAVGSSPPFAAAWVEEYLDGIDLAQDLNSVWDVDRTAKLMVHVSEALAAFHEQDVVHRDLSPGNVRLMSDGSFKLMDPGLARHLAKSALTGLYQPGTPGHRSPEHVPGGDVQPTSDIFALGILAFLALTGRRPVDISGSEDDYNRRLLTLDCEPIRNTRPEIPADLADVIDRCLKRQPARRFIDGAEILEEMRKRDAVFLHHFG